MTSLLNDTYLDTDGIAKSIVGLTKKTSSTQLEIGKLILSVKNQVSVVINPLISKKAIEKDKQMKKSLTEQISAINGDYDAFLATLPFGKVVANKFADIASDKLIAKYIDIAPIAYNTMYDMKGTAEPVWKYLKEQGMTSYTAMTEVKKMKQDYIDLTADPVDEAPVDEAPADEASNDVKSADEMSLGETLDAGIKLGKQVGKKTINPVSNLQVSDDKTSADLIFVNTAIVKINENVSKELFAKLYVELENVVSDFAKSNALKTDDVMLEKSVAYIEFDKVA